MYKLVQCCYSPPQLHVLDEAAKHHPDAWWWLKADGCDIVSGLCESTRGFWSGDVDLDDGKLEQEYAAYQDWLKSIENLKLLHPPDDTKVFYQLTEIRKKIQDGLVFLYSGTLALNIVSIDVVNSLYINLFLTALQKAQANYEEKQTSSRIPEKTLFKLAWEVNELGSLIQEGRRLVVELDVLAKKVQDGELNRNEENIARQLTSVRKDLVAFVQTLSKHQRNPATHIFVFMISPENRKSRPYALPVQCLPISSLKDSQVRNLANKIIKEMSKRNMKVAGE